MLRNGKWSKTWDPYQATSEKGEFVRQISEFRSWVTPDGAPGRTGSGGFKAEAGRYHLYISYVCPWACRAMMVRALKQLTNVISFSVVEPFLTDEGWKFGEFPGADTEPFFNDQYLHQLYSRAASNYTGRATVPILWDKKLKTIVNNESADIIEMFNSAFDGLVGSDAGVSQRIDLRPEADLVGIKRLNQEIYDTINNGVYKAGFAKSQEAYEDAYHHLFNALDKMEAILQQQNYLLGDTLTEPDIRLFVTLIRFDAAYYGLFKCNKKRIADYPALTRYIHTIYAMPGIADTVNIHHIKTGYYSVKVRNPQCIVPVGPEGEHWHHRALNDFSAESGAV